MCGIAGYHGLPADPALLERMNACQQHRGPDGDGILTDGACGLAHRRLSIIDVAHGQQPMDTADGRYSIAYNGEVYNYLELRAELEALGRSFATDSDTEVVLAGVRAVGPRRLRPLQRHVRPRRSGTARSSGSPSRATTSASSPSTSPGWPRPAAPRTARRR